MVGRVREKRNLREEDEEYENEGEQRKEKKAQGRKEIKCRNSKKQMKVRKQIIHTPMSHPYPKYCGNSHLTKSGTPDQSVYKSFCAPNVQH